MLNGLGRDFETVELHFMKQEIDVIHDCFDQSVRILGQRVHRGLRHNNQVQMLELLRCIRGI